MRAHQEFYSLNFFSKALKALCIAIKKRETKGFHLENKEGKLEILRLHDCLHRKSHETFKKLLEPTGVFSKITEHKINVQKSILVLHNSNNE